MTAKDTFKQMMKNEISPELRRLGFKGSGVSYSYPHPDLHLLIYFRTDAGIEPSELRFTVSVSIIGKAEYEEKWRPYFPKNPTAASIFPFGRQFRIGALTGVEDQWWRINQGQPAEATAREVVDAIKSFVVPELLRGSMKGPSLNRPVYDNS